MLVEWSEILFWGRASSIEHMYKYIVTFIQMILNSNSHLVAGKFIGMANNIT